MQYNERKAAQMAVFFIRKEGGQIELLKLMKLMYLAERESYKRHGEPISGDVLVSMQHGPVLSITLDHANSFVDSVEDGWEDWISDREDHLLALKKDGELLYLSDADEAILESVWNQYSGLSASQLRNHTHAECPEWEDPGYSSSRIPPERLFKVLGFDAETVDDLTSRLEANLYIDRAFKSQAV